MDHIQREGVVFELPEYGLSMSKYIMYRTDQLTEVPPLMPDYHPRGLCVHGLALVVHTIPV